MKIEAGESLFLSWLRHVKECQLVHTNWKPSPQWERKNEGVLEELMQKSSMVFKDYDLYKGTKGVDQLLKQAEIDVLGVSFNEGVEKIYAIDVAFHEAGLNYGSKDETIARVLKKYFRTAMCILGYFNHFVEAEIIFASPKINPSVEKQIYSVMDEVDKVIHQIKPNYQIRILANSNFESHVLSPVKKVVDSVADTSELFMRSWQLIKLIEALRQNIPPLTHERAHLPTNDPYPEMKIGVIVRNVLRNILERGEVSSDEIERLQDKEYSRRTFGIQYPVLLKTNNRNGIKQDRYYAQPVEISGNYYFICSEWYEVPANNDRPLLINWLNRWG